MVFYMFVIAEVLNQNPARPFFLITAQIEISLFQIFRVRRERFAGHSDISFFSQLSEFVTIDSHRLVAPGGFDPPFSGYDSDVLPLDDGATKNGGGLR
jgi:hypothetical protein